MSVLEVCVETLSSLSNAVQGGADRVEICSGLIDGGVTPSMGFLSIAADQIVNLQLPRLGAHVLIRPRPGDFCYSEEECLVIQRDIEACGQLASQTQHKAITGVVIGALQPDGSIDQEFVKRAVELAQNSQLKVTFHRAFDVASGDPVENLKILDELKVDFVLTSGCSPSAGSEEGKMVLKNLIHVRTKDALKIEVIAGGGINVENIVAIKRETGVTQFHGSARTFKQGKMIFKRDNIFMGGEKRNDDTDKVEYGWKITSDHIVKQFKRELKDSEFKAEAS